MARVVKADEVRASLGKGAPFYVLDARAEEEHEAWKLDESGRTETVNIPYFDFMEDEEGYIQRLPRDGKEALVVCAKGGSSEWLAELLEEHGVPAMHLEGGMEAWAKVVDVVPVETPVEGLAVLQVRRVSSGCISYLLWDREARVAAVVDPLEALTSRYVALAETNGVSIEFVLDTHVHADHISGTRALADATGATLVLPAEARKRGLAYDARFLPDGEKIEVGYVALEAFATPGHTSDSLTYVAGGKVAFTGDTLFVDSVGRPDLERGSEGADNAARTLHASLRRMLDELPAETVILPGHYPPATPIGSDEPVSTTLGYLGEHMPVLGLDEDTFSRKVVEDMPHQPARHTEIIAVNLGHSSPDEAQRFEMELGPNNCASSRTSLLDGR